MIEIDEAHRITGWPEWATVWQPPDRRPVWQWAEEHVILPPGYAQPGPISFDGYNYQKPILACASNHRIRRVTDLAPIQTGKTMRAEIVIMWAIPNMPGPIMWTQQTDSDMKEHVKSRFKFLMQACKPVADMMPKGLHAITNQQIDFPGFSMFLNGANLASLQSKSVRLKVNSEIWLPSWQGMMTHALGRVTAYEERGLSKVWDESQAGSEGDEADQSYMAGSQAELAVDCGGGLHPLVWNEEREGTRCGVVWDEAAKNQDGSYDHGRVLETVRYRCPRSGIEMPDTAKTRAIWDSTCEYIHTYPDRDHLSFRYPAIVRRSMRLMVQQWLDAHEMMKRGFTDPMKDFYNKRLAQPWKESIERVVVLRIRNYLYSDFCDGQPVEGELDRFMTIDRQKNHWWYEIRAWCEDGESQQLACGRAESELELEELRERFNITPQKVIEDSGYDSPGTYDDCIRYGWTWCKGEGRKQYTWKDENGDPYKRFISSLQRVQHKGHVAVGYMQSADHLKDILDNLITQGKWGVPQDVIPEYREHFHGEVRKEKRSGVWQWEKVKEKSPNHLWDCAVMQIGLAIWRGLLPDRIQKTEQSKESDEPKPDISGA